MEKLSRRKLAQYVADRAKDGIVPVVVIQSVAAYLTDAGRKREAELVARAIEDELAAHGIVVADVTSAHVLTAAEMHDLQRLIGADELYARTTVDPSVIGGVRVATPAASLDATIINRLHALKRAKL